MPDYVYDIFVSAKSGRLFDYWIDNVFFPLFEDLIVEDAAPILGGRKAKIYYYRNSLEPGDPWPDDLRAAITTSRLALALCSPRYFFSRWCRTEFDSFLHRLKHHNAKVLIPVSIHDGKNFPEYAKRIQAADLSDYVFDGEVFKDTPKYLEFQTAMKNLCAIIASRLEDVPAYQEWPVIEMPANESDMEEEHIEIEQPKL